MDGGSAVPAPRPGYGADVRRCLHRVRDPGADVRQCLHRVRDPAGGPLAARVAARRLTLRSTTPSPPRTRCSYGRAAARASATLRQCMARRPTREPSLGTVMPGLRARWSWPPGVSDFSAGANGRGPDRIPPAGQALIGRSAPDPARWPGTTEAGTTRIPPAGQAVPFGHPASAIRQPRQGFGATVPL
jgi:hypothetical protein